MTMTPIDSDKFAVYITASDFDFWRNMCDRTSLSALFSRISPTADTVWVSKGNVNTASLFVAGSHDGIGSYRLVLTR